MFPPTGPDSGIAGMLDAIMSRGAVLPQGSGRKPRPVPGVRRDGQPNGLALYEMLEAQSPEGDSALRKIYNDVRQASLDGRPGFERSWWQKLLYYNGRQWIYYSDRNGWQDKRLAKWIPRPVTNICQETVDSARAMLSAIQPSARIRPNGTDPKNVITAQMFDDLEPALQEEHRMKTRWFEADFWATILGCVFLHPIWDRDDDSNSTFIQAKQCGECGYQTHPLEMDEDDFMGCPQCGAPPEAFTDAVDEAGEPIGEQATLGTGKTFVVSPLELMVPTYYQRWDDVDRLIHLRWRPETYYQGRPYEDQIQFSNSVQETSLEMYRSMATMTGQTTANVTTSGNSQTRTKGCIEAELWIRPCTEYPHGLWARFVGGSKGTAVIVRDEERGVLPGPLPYETRKGKKLWPWVYYPFNPSTGKLFPNGILDSIITKQDAINRGDSMRELMMQRMGNPVWLEPKGAEVQRFTGEPGQIVRYQIVAGTSAKPERIDGLNPPSSIFTVREQDFADAERLSGMQDVLKGIKPGAVEAFSSLQLLVERSQSRFATLFMARGEAYRGWLDLGIELERSYGPEARTRAIAGPNNTWTFQQFQNADLQGAVQVITEDGSTTPKTSLGKRAMLQEAKNMGFINSENPDTQYAALELLGGTVLAPGLNAHTKAAQVEQEQYLSWVMGNRQGPNPLKVEAWHGHPIHVQQLDLWANTDIIRDLTMRDPVAQMEITVHRCEHLIAMQNPLGMPKITPQMMMALNPAPMGNPNAPGGELGPAAPAPAAGAGRALMNSDQESGAVDTLPGNETGAGNMPTPVM